MIVILTIGSLILSSLFYPKIKIKKIQIQTFWVVALIGVILSIIFKTVSIKNTVELLVNSKVNPFKIVILFISITIISIVLDESGFFVYLASKLVYKANSQIKLFIILFSLISVLTVFTSNDIVILTFTPFIIALTRRLNINPIPYLFSSFVAANTFSVMLLIGNPTNILIGLAFNITFVEYFKVMFIPSLVGGITSFMVCFLIFRKELKTSINIIEIEELAVNKKVMIIALAHLAICTILLSISNFINIEMYFICLVFGISISFLMLLIDYKIIKRALIKTPWNLMPFIVCMFILIQSITNSNNFLIFKDCLLKMNFVFKYGIISVIGDNLINNIPMSLLSVSLVDGVNSFDVYSLIVGSNIGAYLTPIGALAGMMWINILNRNNINFSYLKFIKYGIIVVSFVFIFTLLTLLLII